MANELVKSVGIENMVNQRAAVMGRLRQAVALICEAEKLADAAHVGFPRFVVDGSKWGIRAGGDVHVSGKWANLADVEVRLLSIVDAEGWQYLMSESGLRTFMDAGTRRKWDEQILTGDVPPLDLPNIEATFSALYEHRREMFEQGVIECFRKLSWCYKSNEAVKFGRRIILSSFFGGGSPNVRSTDELDDLMRVFHVLDSKPEADHRDGVYAMVMRARKEGKTEAGNDYLSVRLYRPQLIGH